MAKDPAQLILEESFTWVYNGDTVELVIPKELIEWSKKGLCLAKPRGGREYGSLRVTAAAFLIQIANEVPAGSLEL
jgi:hypothetical protein